MGSAIDRIVAATHRIPRSPQPSKTLNAPRAGVALAEPPQPQNRQRQALYCVVCVCVCCVT
jgi:hypothetical protein